MSKFSERLKVLREEKGLSYQKLGEILGVSGVSLGYYERGERVPDIHTLQNVCSFFNVTSDYMIGLSDCRNTSVETESVIEHPSHYRSDKYECIEVMREVFGKEATSHFCLLNAFKYIWRCGKKHESPDEDINKAIWYLNKYLATKEENA